ncbi:TRANSPOSON [Ceraceosorus bombacis]|uniref:TRANSPOSON n=1 Tax=Ceraceosorus bombacis TaxID=401625 RepID=A0A0P1BK03_9BASI|nr:TRANSPOSON [Ceraceosorus bombacis]
MFRPPSRSLGQASEAANRHLEELSAINTAVRRSDAGHNANAQASEGLLRLSSLSASRSAGQHGAFMNTYGSSTPTSMTTSASFSGTHTPSLSRSLSPSSSINSSFTNGTGQSLASSAAAAMANSADVKIKKRLSNVDRKQICEYARDHPHERQEVVGNHFGVERSTVSKIMKDKDKWLAIDVEREGHVVKHRNARFPEIEKEVCAWLAKEAKRPSDKEIMNKAAKIAAAHGELTFKASAGWLVKFRERLGRQGLRFDDSSSLQASRRDDAASIVPSSGLFLHSE